MASSRSAATCPRTLGRLGLRSSHLRRVGRRPIFRRHELVGDQRREQKGGQGRQGRRVEPGMERMFQVDPDLIFALKPFETF